jgi:hypothetical protein
VSDTTSPLRGEVLPTKNKPDDGCLVCNPPSPSPARKILPYGPFVDSIDPSERARQLRGMAGIVACHLGSGHPLASELRAAEINGDALQSAFAIYARLMRPRPRRAP